MNQLSHFSFFVDDVLIHGTIGEAQFFGLTEYFKNEIILNAEQVSKGKRISIRNTPIKSLTAEWVVLLSKIEDYKIQVLHRGIPDDVGSLWNLYWRQCYILDFEEAKHILNMRTSILSEDEQLEVLTRININTKKLLLGDPKILWRKSIHNQIRDDIDLELMK